MSQQGEGGQSQSGETVVKTEEHSPGINGETKLDDSPPRSLYTDLHKPPSLPPNSLMGDLGLPTSMAPQHHGGHSVVMNSHSHTHSGGNTDVSSLLPDYQTL